MFSKYWSFYSTKYLFSLVDAFFSTNGRFSNGNKLYSSTCWPIPSLLWGWLYGWSDPKKEHRLARSFNLSFRYIDDVLSLNNPSFGDLMMHRIYPKELAIKETTDIAKLASYLDLYLKIDGKGKLLTQLYDKRNDFSFRVAKFSFICGNIPLAPVYEVFISQLILCQRSPWLRRLFVSR